MPGRTIRKTRKAPSWEVSDPAARLTRGTAVGGDSRAGVRRSRQRRAQRRRRARARRDLVVFLEGLIHIGRALAPFDRLITGWSTPPSVVAREGHSLANQPADLRVFQPAPNFGSYSRRSYAKGTILRTLSSRLPCPHRVRLPERGKRLDRGLAGESQHNRAAVERSGDCPWELSSALPSVPVSSEVRYSVHPPIAGSAAISASRASSRFSWASSLAIIRLDGFVLTKPARQVPPQQLSQLSDVLPIIGDQKLPVPCLHDRRFALEHESLQRLAQELGTQRPQAFPQAVSLQEIAHRERLWDLRFEASLGHIRCEASVHTEKVEDLRQHLLLPFAVFVLEEIDADLVSTEHIQISPNLDRKS